MLYILQTALELGLLYAPVALALFLSYRILDIADLTTDGAFTLGAAVSVTVCIAGHPVLAVPAAMAAGAAAGFVTAFLQTKLGVPSILAGIITNIGLYSVNLMVMGKSNQSLFQTDTIYTLAKGAGFAGSWYKLAVTALIVLALAAALVLFLGTAGPVCPGHRGQYGYGAGILHQHKLHHHRGPVPGQCYDRPGRGHGGQYNTFADVNGGTGNGGAGHGRSGHWRDPHR